MESVSVVILGAGFSAAATGGRTPLMRNFFDALTPERSPRLHEYITLSRGDVATANVEKVLLAMDQMRNAPDGVLSHWAGDWKAELPALERNLAQYTLDRLRDGLEIEDDWAANLLAECGPGTSVVSMNYDNIAESILSNREGLRHGTRNPTCPHCKMRVLLEVACNCRERQGIEACDWRGAITKPHGSVAWKRCLNPECCSHQCLVADERCKPFEPCHCPNCGEGCGPALVMPTMSKHLDDLPEISIMWQAARMAIAEAESILIFGFSMPVSDELLMQMLRFSIHGNRKLKRVAVIDLDPDGVLDRFRDCIPADASVETLPLKVVPSQTPDWYMGSE